MIRLIKTVFILTIFAIGLSNCQTVFANEYKVKPVILVPKEWQSNMTQDKLEKYKAGILNGLKVIQKYYSKNLLGKTFDYEESVDVIFSNRFSTIQKAKYASNIFFQTEGELLLPSRPKTIYAVWSIGSGNLIQGTFGSGIIPKIDGIAVLNHEDILRLAGPDGIERNNAIGVLGHELGHTFGLVETGYAKMHPCTQISKDQCTDNAPQPLPDQIEYRNSIMGSGWNIFPESILTNTLHNPVVHKAFQSLYLNPTKDPAPKPQTSVSPPKIQSIFPEVAIVEETVVELKGINFGNNQGEVILSRDENQAEKVKVQKINSWSDSSIKIVLSKEAAKYASLSTPWKVQVIKSPGSAGTAPHSLLAKNKLDSSKQLPTTALSVRLSITCGPDTKPLDKVKVSLVEGKTLSKILKETTTNKAGQAIIEHTITQATTQSEFNILVEQLSGIPPAIPRTHKISLVNNQEQPLNLNFSSSFHECPKDQPGLEKEDQNENRAVTYGTEEVEIVKEVVSVSPSNSEITEVTISNYQDFRVVNDQGDEGSATQSEQYQSNKKIDWITSTLTADPQVYVQILYSNKQPENYSIEVNTKETVTHVGEMELRIKRELPKETAQEQAGQEIQATQTRRITIIYLAAVSGDYVADLYKDGQYFDPKIDITEVNTQFKIIRCFSDLSCDDPNLAKAVNLSVEVQPQPEEFVIQQKPTEPEQVAPQPTFYHRTCGDVSGNVIVDVYSDGSEVAGTNCEDLDKICQVFDSEGRQDATCVEQQSLE